jgi:hypothetical protein
MSPGPEDEVSQAEKARMLREQASSILDHARAAANDLGGGRFAGVNPTTVIGAEPAVRYPAASSSWQVQLPDEPPLGFAIDAMPELENPTGGSSVSAPVATGGAADAPSAPPDVEHAAPPPSSEQTNE